MKHAVGVGGEGTITSWRRRIGILGTARQLIRSMLPLFVRRGVWKYRRFIEYCRFTMHQRRLNFQIPDRPWLDEDSSAIFLQMLEDCNYYLEYGSGGSTVMAAKLKKGFVSVDTDRFFIKALRKRTGELDPNQNLLWGNIGLTKEFGFPVFQTPNNRRQRMWKAYIELPWLCVNKDNLPDLVMIDGRFRVAAALTSFVYLMNSPNSRIVVDDYVTRPYYHVIEKYSQRVCIAGRMAIFEPPSQCSGDIYDAIKRYSTDWQ